MCLGISLMGIYVLMGALFLDVAFHSVKTSTSHM